MKLKREIAVVSLPCSLFQTPIIKVCAKHALFFITTYKLYILQTYLKAIDFISTFDYTKNHFITITILLILYQEDNS